MKAELKRRIARAVLRLPDPVLRALSGGGAIAIEGRVLEAQIQIALAAQAARGGKRTEELSPVEARLAASLQDRPLVLPTTEMADVSDVFAEASPSHLRDDEAPLARPVSLRIYRPRRQTRGAVLFFHGGGGVLGSVERSDSLARFLAHRGRVTVLSVQYRLAPEAPFPAAVVDAFVAWQWLCEHTSDLDLAESRIAVAGSSFGGNLAANICHRMAEHQGRQPKAQLLICPWLDLASEFESHTTCGHGFGLDKGLLDWFKEHYLAGHRADDPRASPALAVPEHLGSTAIIGTAGFDPLRDDGDAYAVALEENDNPAYHRFFPTLVHGFPGMAGAVTHARLALCELSDLLTDELDRR